MDQILLSLQTAADNFALRSSDYIKQDQDPGSAWLYTYMEINTWSSTQALERSSSKSHPLL